MYKFTVGSVLLLTAQNTDLNLRTPVGSNGAVDGTGGTGVAAKWVVYSATTDVKAPPPATHSTSSSSAEEKKVHDEKAELKTTEVGGLTPYRLVQLQRYQDPTYFLRIYNDWVDASGLANESPNYLRISDSSTNIVIMTSNDNPNQRIGILTNGSIKTPSTVGTGIAAQFSVTDVTFSVAAAERARETVRLTAYNNVHPDALGKIMRMDADGTVDDKGSRGQTSSFVLKVIGSEGPKVHKRQDIQGPIVTVQLQWDLDPQRNVCLHENGTIDGKSDARDERVKLILHKQHGIEGVYALESKQFPGTYLDFTGTWDKTSQSNKPPLLRLTLTDF